MTHQPSNSRIEAIVLAAGQSTRFGSSKMIAPVNGRPMVQHALLAAQIACKGAVHLVVGHDNAAIVNAAAGIGDQSIVNRIIVNPAFARGIGTSIAAGVRACRDRADAILILLGDQALIKGDHLLQLINTWSGDDSEIIASAFDDVRGPPILFPKKCFGDLADLDGDDGAKTLMENQKFKVITVPCKAARFDIDKQEDLQQLDKL